MKSLQERADAYALQRCEISPSTDIGVEPVMILGRPEIRKELARAHIVGLSDALQAIDDDLLQKAFGAYGAAPLENTGLERCKALLKVITDALQA